MPDKALAEEQRLAALYALELLDTARCERFDRICRLAAEYFNCLLYTSDAADE